MKETALVKSITDYLAYRQDVFCWRQNTGALKIDDKRFIRFGFPGIADIIGVFKGRFLAIEAKVGRNKQSEHQYVFQQRVESVGGLYILAYSLDDVIRELK